MTQNKLNQLKSMSNHFLIDGSLISELLENNSKYINNNMFFKNISYLRQLITNSTGKIFNSNQSLIRECISARRSGTYSPLMERPFFKVAEIFDSSSSNYQPFDNDCDELSAMFYYDTASLALGDIADIKNVNENISSTFDLKRILNDLHHFAEDIHEVDKAKYISIEQFFEPFFNEPSDNVCIYDKQLFLEGGGRGKTLFGFKQNLARNNNNYVKAIQIVYFFVYWVEHFYQKSSKKIVPTIYLLSSPSYDHIYGAEGAERQRTIDLQNEQSYKQIAKFIDSIINEVSIQGIDLSKAYKLINKYLDKDRLYTLLTDFDLMKNLQKQGGLSFEHKNLVMTDYGLINWDLRKRFLSVKIKDSKVELGKGDSSQDIVKYLIYNPRFKENSNKWIKTNEIADKIITKSLKYYNLHIKKDENLIDETYSVSALKEHFS